MRSSTEGARLSAAAVGAAAVVAAVLSALLVWSLWPTGAPVPPDFGDRAMKGYPACRPFTGRRFPRSEK
ncbi:hypothetical protein [Streptomyces sp. B8F3]|uniref:hypothetical protein n=1 Tax=unclassified Streptomyces TaxID=2593676 RepID=UPI00325F7811